MNRHPSDYSVGHPVRDEWEADQEATERRWRERSRISDSEVADNLRLLEMRRAEREGGSQ